MRLLAILVTIFSITACTDTPHFQVINGEYSTWNDEEHYIAKKTILLDNRTGQTWSLSYKKNNNTSDGFAWEPLGNAKKR